MSDPVDAATSKQFCGDPACEAARAAFVPEHPFRTVTHIGTLKAPDPPIDILCVGVQVRSDMVLVRSGRREGALAGEFLERKSKRWSVQFGFQEAVPVPSHVRAAKRGAAPASDAQPRANDFARTSRRHRPISRGVRVVPHQDRHWIGFGPSQWRDRPRAEAVSRAEARSRSRRSFH